MSPRDPRGASPSRPSRGPNHPGGAGLSTADASGAQSERIRIEGAVRGVSDGRVQAVISAIPSVVQHLWDGAGEMPAGTGEVVCDAITAADLPEPLSRDVRNVLLRAVGFAPSQQGFTEFSRGPERQAARKLWLEGMARRLAAKLEERGGGN